MRLLTKLLIRLIIEIEKLKKSVDKLTGSVDKLSKKTSKK